MAVCDLRYLTAATNMVVYDLRYVSADTNMAVCDLRMGSGYGHLKHRSITRDAMLLWRCHGDMMAMIR